MSTDDVSGLSSGIRLESWSDTQTRQPWDDDSGFWEDPATLRAIAELTLAEIKDAARREQPTRGSPPPTKNLQDNRRESGGNTGPLFAGTMPATLSHPSQLPQSMSKCADR